MDNIDRNKRQQSRITDFFLSGCRQNVTKRPAEAALTPLTLAKKGTPNNERTNSLAHIKPDMTTPPVQTSEGMENAMNDMVVNANGTTNNTESVAEMRESESELLEAEEDYFLMDQEATQEATAMELEGDSMPFSHSFHQLRDGCFPDPVSSPLHTVLCASWPRLPTGRGYVAMSVHGMEADTEVPTQWTAWDNNHVKMPYSTKNKSIHWDKTQQCYVTSWRWDTICEVLARPMRTSKDIENAILSYNMTYKGQWDFRALHRYIKERLTGDQREELFLETLPAMCDLVRSTPTICPLPIPLMQQGQASALTLSQHQAACLLANAFFCTFPRRNAQTPSSEYGNYPSINFTSLYGLQGALPSSVKVAKLHCIFHYFRRVTLHIPLGQLTFQRCVLNTHVDWMASTADLPNIVVSDIGMIEDEGKGLVQVDFANQVIGGGVLGRGAVQEEIRFLICPEMIISRLLCEAMMDNETIILMGCEMYSKYRGYASTFEWAGPAYDTTESDMYGRKLSQVIAIDALVFNSYQQQFKTKLLTRELTKAYCGFMSHSRHDASIGPLPAVATGNWGCGAFGGDLQLKAVLQMMAAGQAGRDMVYFTFGDKALCKGLQDLHATLREHSISV
eukprot:Ihof_evm5s142 gene=Ihof_evmTU5s142